MVGEEEVTETPKEVAKNGSDGNTASILVLMIVPTLIVACTLLYFCTSYQTKPDNNVTLPVAPPEVITSTKKLPTQGNARLSKKHKLEPNCTIDQYFREVLRNTSADLYRKNLLCTPEDFHNLEKHSMPNLASNNKKVPEPKGHFVIYIAVGLLLTSLAAALVDVYKVKGKPSKTKPQLIKRCSLADLTVLRHSRRESMRKDSIVEEQRGPLKLLGARPPPEQRRCSFPPYHAGEFPSYGHGSPRQTSRKASLDCYDDIYSQEFHHNRVVRLMRRF